MLITSFLNQTAVRWPYTGRDGYGKNTYSTATEIKVRWQDVIDLFRNAQGKEEVSTAHVFADTEFQVEDYLYLGTLASLSAGQKADPLLVTDAYPIKKVVKSYDISGTLANIKGIL